MATAYEQKTALEVEAAGSAIEAAAAIAVVVLAIIGLARGDAGYIMSITTIVLGATLALYGMTIAAEYSKLMAMASKGALGALELGGGMTVEMLAGGSAVVLGILGLIGFAPVTLDACAVIAAGATLVLSAGGFQRLNTLKIQAAELPEAAENVAKAAVMGTIAAQVLAGAAAVILGILALTTADAAVLTLIGLLVLGGSVAASGFAMTGRMFRLFDHKSPA